MKIRLFQMRDLERGFLETLGSLRPLEYLPPERWREIAGQVVNSPQQQTFVLIQGDQVVATGSLLVEQKFLHGGGRVAHIEDIAVHRDHQGEGLGRKMVGYLVNRANQVGCYKVILDCTGELEDFYKACGFYRHENQMRLDF